MVPNILGGGYMDVFLTWIPGVNSHYRVMGPFRLVSFELRLRLVLSNYRLQAGNDKERGQG